MRVVALLLAAGRGERLGGEVPKAFVSLAGRPLWLHALVGLAGAPEVERVVPVVAASERERFRRSAREAGLPEKLAEPITGGAERQDSVRAGLSALPEGAELVVVHDAARALVRPEAVSRVVAEARRHGAAILAGPVRDTIKRVEGDRIVETPPRAACRAAQTPQVFRTELLREAHEKARAEGFLGTDDAQLVERLGVAVRVVRGGERNLKITHRADLALAEHWLSEARA